MRATRLLVFCVLSLSLASSAFAAEPRVEATYGDGPNAFTLATGSPGELGLVKALGEAFAAKAKASLRWIKAGSGESLDSLRGKTTDMIMVHAPAAERKAVTEGWAGCRTLIGSNEFYIVGPKADPAGVAGSKNVIEAYAKIAKAKAKFYTRADNSGTHKKELSLWKEAGIEPAGDWYIEAKGFMVAALKRAEAEQGYFMTDSSTWIAEKNNTPNLTILFQGDTRIVNTYHALCQAGQETPGVATARAFIAFVASEEGQNIIRAFGRAQYGQGLYQDAAYALQYDK